MSVDRETVKLGIETKCVVELPGDPAPMLIATGATNHLNQVVPDSLAVIVENLVNASNLYDIESVTISVKMKPRASSTWPAEKET